MCIFRTQVFHYESFQFSSVAQSCPTLRPHEPQHARPPCPSPKFTQTHVHWVRDAIQPSHPLLSPSPPAFPSIRVFTNESALRIMWPKYWSLSFGISPSNEYSGLISFRMDWLDLLAAQGTLKSLFHTTAQKHQFFVIQLSSQSNSHIHTRLLEKP